MFLRNCIFVVFITSTDNRYWIGIGTFRDCKKLKCISFVKLVVTAVPGVIIESRLVQTFDSVLVIIKYLSYYIVKVIYYIMYMLRPCRIEFEYLKLFNLRNYLFIFNIFIHCR